MSNVAGYSCVGYRRARLLSPGCGKKRDESERDLDPLTSFDPFFFLLKDGTAVGETANDIFGMGVLLYQCLVTSRK